MSVNLTLERLLSLPYQTLNELCALHIMGWKLHYAGEIVEYGVGIQMDQGVELVQDTWYDELGIHRYDVPNYLTNDFDNLRLLTKMEKSGWDWELRHTDGNYTFALWKPHWVTSNLYQAVPCPHYTNPSRRRAVVIASLIATLGL